MQKAFTNEFCNEVKATLTSTDGNTSAKSVRVLDYEVTVGLEEGYLIFKTTHLSQYGIVATKTGSTSGENTSGNENTEPEVSAPQMGDENHMLLILLTGIGVLVVAMMLRRRMKNAK